ncbi:MAG TPA: pilus assembly protein PilM [Dissulfurispiraceae bacterium]|nr:pilus assembly protein PilM [Dissulfurispiraceae bacterium]
MLPSLDKLKAKNDDATSTERLLDVIRGKTEEPPSPIREREEPERQSTFHRKERPKITIPKINIPQVRFPSKAQLAPSSSSGNIGINIGPRAITLVKAARSQGRWEAVAQKSVPIPSDLDKGSDAYANFLKETISPFCGRAKTETWAVMPSTQVDVRIIRVPKVADKHLATTVLWTLKKEVEINEHDYFFDFKVLEEVQEKETGARKLDVMCYFAPLAEVERFKKLFADIGVPLSGLSTPSLAVQNIFANDVMPLPERQNACLYIGENHSRIDLYSDRELVLSRDIKTGLKSMLHLLMEANRPDGRMSPDEAEKTLFAHLEGRENGEEAVTLDIGSIIHPAIERLVRQIDRTIQHFVNSMGHDRVERMHVSGVVPLNKNIVDYMGTQLGIPSVPFDPLKQAMPTENAAGRAVFISAFGMALSSNGNTPNFLFSYKDKQKAAHVKKFNQAILAGLVAMVLICGSVMLFEWQGAARKQAELSPIERQLQSAPLVTREMVSERLAKSSQKQQGYAAFSKRYAAMAVLSEVAARTPEAVGLTSLNFDADGKGKPTGAEKGGGAAKAAGSDKPGAPEKASSPAIVLEGVITGSQDMLDAALASYVMKLRASPMFSEVVVTTSKIDTSRKDTFLSFVLNLKTGPGK